VFNVLHRVLDDGRVLPTSQRPHRILQNTVIIADLEPREQCDSGAQLAGDGEGARAGMRAVNGHFRPEFIQPCWLEFIIFDPLQKELR
jgi:ATP-dependent Clp protease ATP-binding subunit ClpA